MAKIAWQAVENKIIMSMITIYFRVHLALPTTVIKNIYTCGISSSQKTIRIVFCISQCIFACVNEWLEDHWFLGGSGGIQHQYSGFQSLHFLFIQHRQKYRGGAYLLLYFLYYFQLEIWWYWALSRSQDKRMSLLFHQCDHGNRCLLYGISICLGN